MELKVGDKVKIIDTEEDAKAIIKYRGKSGVLRELDKSIYPAKVYFNDNEHNWFKLTEIQQVPKINYND